MMLIPDKLATRSLKCNGTSITVDVYEIGDPVTIPAHGGVHYIRYCEFKMLAGTVDRICVGVDAGRLCLSSDNDQTRFKSWMPKRGLLRVIEILCSQAEPEVPDIELVYPIDLQLDPQKQDMGFFRKRCRYDVLRFAHHQLLQPQGPARIRLDEVDDSEILSRLYSKGDLETAMKYWAQKEYLINGAMDSSYDVDEARDEEIAAEIERYDWEELQVQSPSKEATQATQRDVFICHASADKSGFVHGLTEALITVGLSVWYDEYTLTLGDSLRRKIDRGLTDSRYGIVVLSSAFFAKNWTQYELDGLVEKENAGEKVILPIWHKVSHDDVRNFSPALANRVAARSDEPMPEIVKKILEVVRPASRTER